MNENETMYSQSNLYIENREKLRLTGVKDVDNFDDSNISVQTQKGEVVISGEQLSISKLDVESGELFVEGTINSFFYHETNISKNSSVFGRFFK